jgi:uncharacterized membrane protein YdjX (TVP38/TMEM64 family)
MSATDSLAQTIDAPATTTTSPERPWLHAGHPSLGWRRALAGVALLAIVTLLLSSPTVHGALLHAFGALRALAAEHAVWAAVAVVAFAALAATIAFLSSWLVVPLAVYTWGPAGALGLLMIGWLLGGAASYAIGRRFGRPVVRWLGFGPWLARYEDRVSHHTPFALAFLFQLALPSEVRGYLFGLGRYAFARYLASLALAELPFGIATVYLGEGLVQRRLGLVVTLGAALVAISVWAWYALHHRLAAARGAGLLAAGLCVAALGARPAAGQATPPDPRARLFVQRGCTECHPISALRVTAAKDVGPDLTFAYGDVVVRYEVTLESFLENPSGVMRLMLAAHLRLSKADRDSMVATLKRLYAEHRADDEAGAPAPARRPIAGGGP